MAQLVAEMLENRVLLSASPWADDWGDDFLKAGDMSLSPGGVGRIAAALQYDGDVDVFRFVAPRTGRIQIEDRALPGSNFVTMLNLFDEDGGRLSPERFARDGRHSLLSFLVEEGQTYFVKALAAPPADPPLPLPPFPGIAGTRPHGEGDFELFFGFDDAGDDAATATFLDNPAGPRTGQIDVPSDVDRYLFVAPMSGQMRLQWNLPSPGTMRLLDANENELSPTGLLAGSVEFAIEEGELYYLEMMGPEEWPEDGPPAYEVLLSWLPAAAEEAPPSEPAPTTPAPTDSGGRGGKLVDDDFLGSVNLGAFFVPSADESGVGSTTGVLPLDGAGPDALVGALLSGGPTSAAGMAAAYFGAGGGSPGDEASTKPAEEGVSRVNFKMGVSDALQDRLDAARRSWLEGDSPDETASALTSASALLAEELSQLGRPLGDAALSLFQQISLMSQSLMLDEARPESEAGPEAVIEPEPIGERRAERKPERTRAAWPALAALLLVIGAAQLHWPGRWPRRRPRRDDDGWRPPKKG